MNYFRVFQEYDVSSSCIADIAYFLWTAMDYTRSNEGSNDYTNCTRQFQMHNQNHQWIFNGMILSNMMVLYCRHIYR